MRGGETEGEKRTGKRSSKARAKTDIATTPSVAEEANTSLVGNNRAYSDGRSGKDECSNNEGTRTRDRDGLQKRPLCYGDR